MDFFKPADLIYRVHERGGAFIRGSAFIRDNTVSPKLLFSESSSTTTLTIEV